MKMEQTIMENKNLVYYCANYFRNYKNKEDLQQAGFMGLVKAFLNFDNTKDCKFSTYAYNYIIGEMLKVIREDKSIKINRNISKMNLKIDKAYILLSQKLMRNPTPKEIADYLEVDEYIVIEALNSTLPIKSLDSYVKEEGEMTLEEVIGYTDNKDELILLKDSIQNLDADEKDLIRKRYMEDKTQSEVSNLMDMSQVQVSRKEKKILQKLRTKMVA